MYYPNEFKCEVCCKTKDIEESVDNDCICKACFKVSFNCDCCGEYVKKVNKDNLCEKCIPKYIKFNNVKEYIDYKTHWYEVETTKLQGQITVLMGFVDALLWQRPHAEREHMLTTKIETSMIFIQDHLKEKIFIKPEDKIMRGKK